MEALIMTLAGTGVVALVLKVFKEKRGIRRNLLPRFA